jgi:hypothetical protein
LGQACGCDAEREQDEREWQRRKKEIAAREGWIRADERAAIVEDLRAQENGIWSRLDTRTAGAVVGELRKLADRYERGEHAKEGG